MARKKVKDPTPAEFDARAIARLDRALQLMDREHSRDHRLYASTIYAGIRSVARAVLPGRQQRKNLDPQVVLAIAAFARRIRERTLGS